MFGKKCEKFSLSRFKVLKSRSQEKKKLRATTFEYTYVNILSDFQTGGNLEDLLLDIEHLSHDLEQMQFENNRIYDEFGAQLLKADQAQPYRSEMNLILSFDGAKPTFTEEKNDTSREKSRINQCSSSVGSSNISQKSKDVVNNLETPSPKIPQAMNLLPNTLPYIKKSDKKPQTSPQSGSEPAMLDTNTSSKDSHPNRQIDSPIVAIPLPPPVPLSKDKSNAKSNGNTATVRRHFFRHNSSGIKIFVDKENVTEPERSSGSPERSASALQVPKQDGTDTQSDQSKGADSVRE